MWVSRELSYIEIDDADTEHTHLWVTVNDADGAVLEIIEHPLEERVRAYAMARRLANLVGLPLKVLKDRDREARPITEAGFQIPHDARVKIHFWHQNTNHWRAVTRPGWNASGSNNPAG